jgi:hypothetical protein
MKEKDTNFTLIIGNDRGGVACRRFMDGMNPFEQFSAHFFFFFFFFFRLLFPCFCVLWLI